jgi:secreted trypsin-like serine protease
MTFARFSHLRNLLLIPILLLAIAIAIAGGSAAMAQKSKPKPIDVAPYPAPADDSARSGRSADIHAGTNRIVGGVLSPGRPFVVAFLEEKDGKWLQYCGGSVIATRWVLTAAHCLVRQGEMAIVGRSNLAGSGGQQLTVHRTIAHDEYDPDTKKNDLALVELTGDISDTIERVQLDAPPAVGTRVMAAGWGFMAEKNDGGQSTLRLREVDVPVVEHGTCKKSYLNLTDRMMCAGEEGKDSCQGDSGGPLFVMNGTTVTQYGVVSRGKGCGRKGFPGVYSRVDRFREWIQQTINQ